MTPILCSACRGTVPADAGACPACGAFVPPPVAPPLIAPGSAVVAGSAVVPGSAVATPPSLDAGKASALTNRQIVGEALWVLFMIGTYWATFGRPDGNSNSVGYFAVQLVGCHFVASHRGRSMWWTAVGLLPVLCLALPFVLPTRNPARPPRLPLVPRIVLALLAMCAATGVIVTSSSERRSGPAAPALPSAWQRQQAAGVRLEAPIAVDRDGKAMEQLPAEARALVADCELVSGSSRGGNFGVSVFRRTLSAGYEYTLDGLLEAAVADAARAIGAEVLHVTVKPREVDGLEGRHVEAAMRVRETTLRMDGVLAGSGQTTWIVLVTYEGTAATFDARRILMSVEIPRGKSK